MQEEIAREGISECERRAEHHDEDRVHAEADVLHDVASDFLRPDHVQPADAARESGEQVNAPVPPMKRRARARMSGTSWSGPRDGVLDTARVEKPVTRPSAVLWVMCQNRSGQESAGTDRLAAGTVTEGLTVELRASCATGFGGPVFIRSS